jgi:hypothetical protein
MPAEPSSHQSFARSTYHEHTWRHKTSAMPQGRNSTGCLQNWDDVNSGMWVSLSIQLHEHLTPDHVITGKSFPLHTEVRRCSTVCKPRTFPNCSLPICYSRQGTTFIGMRFFFSNNTGNLTLHGGSFIRQPSLCSVPSDCWYQVRGSSIKTNTQSSWASPARTLAIRYLPERTDSVLQIPY